MSLIIGFGHKARNGKDEAIQAILKDITGGMDARAYGFGDALKLEVNEAARIVGGMRDLFYVLRSERTPLPSSFRVNGYFPETPTSAVYVSSKLVEIPPSIADAPKLPDWVVFDENAPTDDPFSPLGKQRALLQWWGTEYRRSQDPDYWVKKLMKRIAEENPDVALIRDLRFPNEFEAIRGSAGYCVKVVRVGFQSDVPEHSSEQALDFLPDLEWDAIISAVDGNLAGLHSSALDCFALLWDVDRTRRKPRTPIAPPPEIQMPIPIQHPNKEQAHRFCK